MDGRWLIAVVLAGCRGAHADPAPSDPGPIASGITAPAGWKALPTVAGAASDAARKILGGDAQVHAQAWGETSRGCFLAVIDARSPHVDQIPAIESALRAALGDLGVTDWQAAPTVDADDVTARWSSGALRARIALDATKFPQAIAAACFYNDRQPAVCESACAPLLAMLAPP